MNGQLTKMNQAAGSVSQNLKMLPFDVLIKHYSDFQGFIDQMFAAGVDYHIIQGSKELSKVGAEKLRLLFQLEVKTRPAEKIIDHDNQFCLFSFECEIKDSSGRVAGYCIGTANNKESKFKQKNGQAQPFYDVIHKVSMRGQKRAFVGAIKQALSLSKFFDYDLKDIDQTDYKTLYTEIGIKNINNCLDLDQLRQVRELFFKLEQTNPDYKKALAEKYKSFTQEKQEPRIKMFLAELEKINGSEAGLTDLKIKYDDLKGVKEYEKVFNKKEYMARETKEKKLVDQCIDDLTKLYNENKDPEKIKVFINNQVEKNPILKDNSLYNKLIHEIKENLK